MPQHGPAIGRFDVSHDLTIRLIQDSAKQANQLELLKQTYYYRIEGSLNSGKVPLSGYAFNPSDKKYAVIYKA